MSQVPSPRFRLPEDTAPLKLCDICSQLSVAALWDNRPMFKTLKHQPGYAALKASARGGCELCAVFFDAITRNGTCHRWIPPREDHASIESRIKPSQAWCLIETLTHMTDDENGISGFRFGLPNSCFTEGLDHYVGYLNVKYTKAEFTLRNCPGPGVGDRNVTQTELTLTPDWNVARRWIQQCTVHHEPCSVKGNSQPGSSTEAAHSSPSRLLDIGTGAGSEPRLIIPDQSTTAYATLSYCWGKSRPLTTTSSNLKQHRVSIPFQSMPRLFQDVIITVRELGIRHIWIDSLCILQDSKEDWELECAKMGHIYQYSIVTICAPAAADTSSGFLDPRSWSEPDPLLWEYKNPGDAEPKRATIAFQPPNCCRSEHMIDYPEQPRLVPVETKSPVAARGWILQEVLLSRRILYFGPHRMYFECNTGSQFEDFPPLDGLSVRGAPGPIVVGPFREDGPLTLHCSISKSEVVSAASAGDEKTRSRLWIKVVREYCRRSLTVPRDKLPALSGVANWLLGSSKEYFADVLAFDILSGLAWFVDTERSDIQKEEHDKGHDDESMPTPSTTSTAYTSSSIAVQRETIRSHKDKYIAPSWSWASTSHAVDFVTLNPNQNPRRDDIQGAQIHKGIVDRLSKHNRLRVDSARIQPRGQDTFGEVTAGILWVRGKVFDGTVVETQQSRGGSGLGVIVVLGPQSQVTLEFIPDNLPFWRVPRSESAGRGSSSKRVVRCLFVQCWYSVRGWVALAVQPLDPKNSVPPDETAEVYNAYQRVGVVGSWGLVTWNFISDSEWLYQCPWEYIELH